MAGYADTYLRGLQQLAPMIHSRRMDEEREANNEFNRRLAVENQKRQYQLMQNQEQNRTRQMQMQMQQQGIAQQKNTQGLELRMQQMLQAQGIANRAAEQRDKPPLKQGYMRDPQDPSKQTPAPGGPAWRDLSSKHSADLGSLGTLHETADAAVSTVDRILDPKKKAWGFETNFGGYNALASQHLPGQTQDTKNDLENLKSNLKTYGAGLVRSSGGSIGSITEREWPILEKQIESLTPLMSEKEAADALGRIKIRLEGMKQRTLNIYKQEWGDSPFYQKEPLKVANPGGAGQIPQGIDPKDWKYMTPEERGLWTQPPTR